MPIRNYSSSVKPADSIGKIQRLVAEHGARNVSMDYENGKPVALDFKMFVEDVLVTFRLDIDAQAMLRAMRADKKVPRHCCTLEQAEITAWKNKYEWLHLQLAEIESNQARLEQLLLGYAVMDDGATLFESLKNKHQLLLEE